MRAPLAALLAERGIVHPSSITRIVIKPQRMTMLVQGARWWDGATDIGKARLIFDFPQDGHLDLSQFGMAIDDEMLDDLAVVPLASTPWAFEPVVYTIYCRGPIPEPLALYAKLQDFLSNGDAPWGPFAYLNGNPRLERFIDLTSRDDYMLSEAPAAVHDIVSKELERQGVAFNVLANARTPSGALGVRLNGATFVCSSAVVEWE